MQNIILAHDGAVVAPPRYSAPQQLTAQQPSSPTQSTRSQKLSQQQQSDADEACAYLHRHCIPSKVENLFSGVLSERPDDPLLYIVEQLRISNSSSAIVNGSGASHTKPPLREPVRDSGMVANTTDVKEPTPPTAPCAPFTRSSLLTEGLNGESASRGNNTANRDEDPFGHSVSGATESICRIVVDNGSTPSTGVEAAERLPASATSTLTPTMTTSVTPSTMPYELLNVFSLGSGRVRTPTPPAAGSNGNDVDHRGSVNGVRPTTYVNRPSSRGSSRNDVPQGAGTVRFGGTDEILYGGSIPPTLDRDESTRSDLSAFSVASVDLQDFLQEFRSAKVESIGEEAKMVDINMLSDILQNVNLPLPDIPIIADLFEEVRRIAAMRYDVDTQGNEKQNVESQKRISTLAVTGTGQGLGSELNLLECISFEAFLARMAFMIQGRYPMEVLRGAFYSIGESTTRKPSADGVAQPCPSLASPVTPQQQKVCAEDIRGFHSGSLSVVTRPYCVAAKSSCRGSNSGVFSANSSSNARTSPTVIPNSAACAINCTAAEHAAETSALLSGVPLALCVEEGLWRGLGLPATREEVDCALRALGIPVDGNYRCHVNEFIRLVNVLTGGGVSALSCEKTSPWGLAGNGRESSFLQQPQE